MASVFKRGGTKTKGYYYASWFDHDGNRKTKCTRTTDKAAAERIAKKFEADAALRRDGVIDPTIDAIAQQSKRTVESHLADYEAKLRAAKNTPQHVSETLGKIRAICARSGFVIAADLNADGVNRFITDWLETNSARSAEAHITAIKGFAKWLSTHDKLPRNPLASVKSPNPKANRRRERRMLLPAEWPWLLAATVNGPERGEVSGRDRAIMYAMAIQTGLRAMELRELTRGKLFLDAKPPYVIAKSGITKNSKEAKQYILPPLAAELKTVNVRKPLGAPALSMPDKYALAEILRADLAEARRQWLEAAHDPDERFRREQSDFLLETNAENEALDFHALRHTCGAWLAMTGAHPKVVQTVMRHCSITLTMDTYGHLFPGQAADAVSKIGTFFGSEDGQLPVTNTGDSNDLSDESAQRLAQRAECEIVRLDASECEGQSATLRCLETLNALSVEGLCGVVHNRARECKMRLLGLEPRTYGLKVRCSTD